MADHDVDLSKGDVQQLSSPDQVAAFFGRLGYDVSARVQQTAAALGITPEAVQRKIQRIERIADHEQGALQVYFVHLDSVTVEATRALARSFRDRAGNYLLVLTSEYQQLDFVLIEREVLPTSASSISGPRTIARPRVFTVQRRDPGLVALRVLRRLTYTEADPDAQYDKLRSAYTVAEWSEPFFNNRALFADYFLNERLRTLPEWAEAAGPVLAQLRTLYASARERFAGSPEATTRKELVEPVLIALGFSTRNRRSGPSEPDYLLESSSVGSGPDGATLAMCLAYTWDRQLDAKDETRDTARPDDNPGARIVSALDGGAAPWALLTNGKLWRLYGAAAHSRATNYYEIDLEDALASPDPGEAFRYFWLLFRAAAFQPRAVLVDGEQHDLSFVEQLLHESTSYARQLGERLKNRVFEDAFPQLAEGFIAHIRHMAGAQADLSQDRLDEVFRGTLTLLYRLLFLLYAEARDLLPVREVRGYWLKSLTRLKREIAAAAGPIKDQASARLATHYAAGPTATDLYDRLAALARIVDQGDSSVNTPVYDGGLFITAPASEDRSPEAVAAHFLLRHKVPDRYLARALDLLARDIDEKRHDLVPIDYKSLGVRQLGSIYEGLLEFRLRVAPEKMAMVKGKKTEEVVPYAEAVRQKLPIAQDGRGRSAAERTLPTGAVYLENNKRERKATGSYYTPDHIVEYIVAHAVGPVLEEHLDKLRPKLRDAELAYHEAVKRREGFRKHGREGDDPEKLANEPRWQAVVDDLFDFRVCDPAMGSGHFLVEAVDFITDRMIDFLNGFPWNPIQAELRRTREAIQVEMERQSVSIDFGKLIDVNLLKRHVLKRCIYGVDLNPMAVELAKLSLWLDCFTLGAPLSFLDHHLKQGNSLIGTTVETVQQELAAGNRGFAGDLFGGPFQGLLASTVTMQELASLPDANVEQSQRSHSLFAEFQKAQAPYKGALDIWISRHFGNKRAVEYLTVTGSHLVLDIAAGGESLSREYRQVISTAASLQETESFFHWDLEFPEAYVDLHHSAWKPKEEQGFDAVIGNPPWVSYSGRQAEALDSHTANYMLANFTVGRRWLSTQSLFMAKCGEILRTHGRLGVVVPAQLSDLDGFRPLREYLSTRGHIEEPCPYHGENAFENVTEPTITVIFIRDRPAAEQSGRWKIDDGPTPSNPVHERASTSLAGLAALFERLSEMEEFGAAAFGDPGVHSGNSAKELFVTSADANCAPVREGRDIQPFHVRDPRLYMRLDLVPAPGRYFRIGRLEQYTKCPIILRQTAHRPIAAIHRHPGYFRNSVLACHGLTGVPHAVIVAILNSDLLAWFHQACSRDARQVTFPQVKVGHLRSFPRPPLGSAYVSPRAERWLNQLDSLLSTATTLRSGTAPQ